MCEKVLKPAWGETIDSFASRMVEHARVSGRVTAEFNELPLEATPSSLPADLVSKYRADVEARRAAYLASDKYKARAQAKEEADREKKAKLEAAVRLAPERATITDALAWDNLVALNRSEYGAAAIGFAGMWARLMEGQLTLGAKLEDIAEPMMVLADLEYGITGFMYGWAVATLARLWKHGEELRRWHNLKTQVGGEGEEANKSGGTLNPALLTFGGKPAADTGAQPT